MRSAGTVIAWVKRCSPTQDGGYILVLRRQCGPDVGLRVYRAYDKGDCLRLRPRGEGWELAQ